MRGSGMNGNNDGVQELEMLAGCVTAKDYLF